MSFQRIAVLGGTGFLGRAVCERLMRRSPSGAVVVPTRRAMHGNRVRALPIVDVRVADVHNDAALRNVLAGCDAAINLVAILHGTADNVVPSTMADELYQRAGSRDKRVVKLELERLIRSGKTPPSKLEIGAMMASMGEVRR